MTGLRVADPVAGPAGRGKFALRANQPNGIDLADPADMQAETLIRSCEKQPVVPMRFDREKPLLVRGRLGYIVLTIGNLALRFFFCRQFQRGARQNHLGQRSRSCEGAKERNRKEAAGPARDHWPTIWLGVGAVAASAKPERLRKVENLGPLRLAN